MNKIVIISGLSGSGKSTALNALEDLDFYAIDNLPIKLLEKFLELLSAGSPEINKIALGMDMRDQEFVKHYKNVFEIVLRTHPALEILFLDSNDESLQRRFSETRRKHPASKTNVAEGIQKERVALGELREMAHVVIDTSTMDVHQLKKRVTEQYSMAESGLLQVRLISFGFKYGLPKSSDLMLDVRFLNNPHFVTDLRGSSGLETSVQKFIQGDPRFSEFVDKTIDYFKFLIPQYRREGKRYLSIGIGCTGGKHRSVYVAELLAERLKLALEGEYSFSVDHQDLRNSLELK